MEEFGQNSNSEEEKNVEIFEFSLTEEDIDELMVKLVELKHTKQPFTYEVDDDNELQVNYEEDEN